MDANYHSWDPTKNQAKRGMRDKMLGQLSFLVRALTRPGRYIAASLATYMNHFELSALDKIDKFISDWPRRATFARHSRPPPPPQPLPPPQSLVGLGLTDG